jgi:hypothetical protein
MYLRAWGIVSAPLGALGGALVVVEGAALADVTAAALPPTFVVGVAAPPQEMTKTKTRRRIASSDSMDL